VQFADTPGFVANTAGSVQTTGAGKVLGLPPGYVATFPGEIRFLVGARDGVLLAQQTAANLHATVGTVVSVERPGLPRVRFTVQGVVDLPAADSLFQAVGVPPGSAPQAPPSTSLGSGTAPPARFKVCGREEASDCAKAPPSHQESGSGIFQGGKKRKTEGTVVLMVIVGADGLPRDIRVTRSLGHGLDEEAIKAVKKWKFKPGTVQGRAVPVQINVVANFRLY